MKLNVLTFDIEDWFHINDATWVPHQQWQTLDARVVQNTENILKLLKEYEVKATFFIMGWIAEKYPQLLIQIVADGHELGYHSYYHMRPKNQSIDEFTSDLQEGLSVILKVTGQKIGIYRAPNLSLDAQTSWLLPVLIEHDIKISSSIRSLRKMHGIPIPNSPFIWQTPVGNIPEFPVNRLNIPGFPLTFTGSGYFRLFPFWFVHYLYNQNEYNNGYFHPNDIDPQIPTPTQLGVIRNWLNTVGSSSAHKKLGHLLSALSFQTIGQAWASITDSAIHLPKIQIK